MPVTTDVYKRQRYSYNINQTHYLTPVSYTHLDVYKRQMIPITSSSKLEKVFVDTCGPFPRSGGRHQYKFIIIIFDHYTKFIKLYPINHATTQKILGVIIQHYIPELGTPKSIITDHRTEFKGRRWKDTLIDNGVKTVSYTHLDVYKRQVKV